MAYTSNQLMQIQTSARTSNTKNIIRNVVLSKQRIPALAASISVDVLGDSNSVFSVQVTRSSDSRFYNFTTNTFLAATTSQSRLKNQSPGVFNLAIPAAASGDTYTVIVMAEPHYGTELSIGNGIRYAENITQEANAEITFATDTSISSVSATAIGTSTGSIMHNHFGGKRPTVVMNDLQLTVPAAIADYGLFIDTTDSPTDLNNGTWNANALYWQTGNYVANGAGTDSTTLILDSVDDLYVGMQVSHVNSVFQTALRSITAINTNTKTLTLDGNETWSNDHVILFRAYGPNLIRKAVSIGLTLENLTCRLGQTTTTFKTETTSNIAEGGSIAVNGTGGIGKGATVRMRGLDKSDSGDPCVVATVTGSPTAGSFTIADGKIEASASRPVRAKTKIYIDGSSNKAYISGTISIEKYPSANQNIYVDTNRIFTIGVNS